MNRRDLFRLALAPLAAPLIPKTKPKALMPGDSFSDYLRYGTVTAKVKCGGGFLVPDYLVPEFHAMIEETERLFLRDKNP